MKTLSFFPIALIIAVFCAGCKDEESICGKTIVWSDILNDNYVYTELTNGYRVLIYEDYSTPEDICPEEHISVSFYYTTKDGQPISSDIIVSGKVYWGAGSEEEEELFFNSSSASATARINDIGLKQAFGALPGWVGIQMIFDFPTKGSFSADTAFINSRILQMSATCTYNLQVI